MKQLQLQDNIRRLLDQAKKLGADQAEVVASIESGYAVNARMGDVETLEHHQEKNLQITVYQDQRTGSASTSDLSVDALMAALTKACAIARYTEQDACAGLADAALMATHYPDLHLSHVWHLAPKQAIEMAIQCDNLARAQDKRIKNSDGASISTYAAYDIYANSHGFIGSFTSSEHAISCSVIAETKNEMQRDYEYTIARDAKKLQSLEWVAQQAASNSIKRLGARKIHTQQCPIIFHSKVAKSLLGNFVAAISGYNLYRHTSFLCNHLNKTIFPQHINIYQDPHLLGEMGSAPFDDEGVATKKIDYIKNGILQNYILGSYSARKLGLQTTGNAGGVFNLFINHGDKDLTQLCKTMGTGLLVTELIGQGVNLMTGDYSRGAFGFWIENGEIQYPVEEITIAGNLRDMFQGIQLIGNDVDNRGNIKTGSILLDRMTVAGN
jgi:PmbA protein